MKQRRGRLAEWERLARVARALGIAERTLRRWADSGVVPMHQAEAGSTIYTHVPSVRERLARDPCLACPRRTSRRAISASAGQ